MKTDPSFEEPSRLTILQIFNKYQFSGGEEASVLRVADTLGQRHRVIRNYYESSEWADETGLFARLGQGLRMLYNRKVIRGVLDTIRQERPDVILLHNIFPVGSSGLIWHLSRQEIPIVQYIHNFRPFSVNGYCWANGRICDSGRRLNFVPEILAASWQESRIKTAWYALNLWLLHSTGAYRRISKWIAISDFMAGYFRDAGIDGDRVVALRHSWNAMPAGEVTGYRAGGTDHFLFLGRLTEEKGIPTLVGAWREAAGRCPGAELVIAGDGPLRDWVEEQARRVPGLRFVGHIEGAEKRRLLAGASAVVVPSIWWEPLGLVVYEAYDNEVPVLAARSGGLTETVRHEETGLLHRPGDTGELAEHLVEIRENPDKAREFGRAGRRFLLSSADPSIWRDEINRHLLEVVTGRGVRRARRPAEGKPLRVSAYLADQNPQLGRSLGISRMSDVVLGKLAGRDDVALEVVTSRSSVRGPAGVVNTLRVPWNTRSRLMRIATDHAHPLFFPGRGGRDLWYYPKGFMPKIRPRGVPAVATIHDTIIQYYQDHFPRWRMELEYGYWAGMLKNTLTRASAIMTVSEHARGQIEDFMRRHGLPEREIHVTYEPCLYEDIPQPENPAKAEYVLHLGSREPHKRTEWLIRQWIAWAAEERVVGRHGALPQLHVVGSIPPAVMRLAEDCPKIVFLPFLEDSALVSQFTAARALIFPSEVEGFGLPAIEAYYLGTPVCHVRGTSVEEVLAVATDRGGFDLERPATLARALEDVLDLGADEIRRTGLELRDHYSARRVVERIMKVFDEVIGDR